VVARVQITLQVFTR